MLVDIGSDGRTVWNIWVLCHHDSLEKGDHFGRGGLSFFNVGFNSLRVLFEMRNTSQTTLSHLSKKKQNSVSEEDLTERTKWGNLQSLLRKKIYNNVWGNLSENEA